MRTGFTWLSMLLLPALPAAQEASAPAEYHDLYTALDARLSAFEQQVSAGWNGQRGDTLFSAELLYANANLGVQLLAPQVRDMAALELDRLKALGTTAVTVPFNFPILYQPFYEFNGNAADYARILAFHRWLADEIRKRGLKMVADGGVMFPGYYSRGSGFNLSGYYRTLNASGLTAARAESLVTVAREFKPDFINIGSEPDTEAMLTGIPSLGTPAGFASAVSAIAGRIQAAGSAARLGAGIGTWQANGPGFLRALCEAPIDVIDLHLYPVNFDFAAKAIAYADIARGCGKRVAMGEAWLLKERDGEFSGDNVAGDPEIFSRDAFSFWAPLDSRLLETLARFAHWKELAYLSPFWSRYFWAYLDYEKVKGASAAQRTWLATRAAAEALQNGELTPTGRAYGAAITGKAPRPGGY